MSDGWFSLPMSSLSEYQTRVDRLAAFRPQARVLSEFNQVYLDILRVLGVDAELLVGVQAYLRSKDEYAQWSRRIQSDQRLCDYLVQK